jgi:hypothetical protein
VGSIEGPLIQPGNTMEEPRNQGESTFSRIRVGEPQEFDMKEFPKVY